ncbi:LysM peptidoglycan-binding domain-containing protein [Aldersonia sp. NBC_00410]|uniref:LysM peptidoglycan-binding domain-containing protein n=1 Tax=Aldersonia sp. NBC_00410 TaxID=2975954 RepID=UPI00225BDF5B|nr:LysM peptidoglycan-binding domain-containing protein [Aldersonia sp. NBC_00410]MCX5043574.1 LysM peptidoglycan-binding domain-containing protein [Aldersonia sp. NBC_00410]
MPQKYQVVGGDTLWSIAQRFYGDGRLYSALAIINSLPNPNNIVVGQELLIPYITYRHEVVPGDTKAAIAARYYGDPTVLWPFELANHVAQRDIHPGERLLIPNLADAGHHTIVPGETLPDLALRWYGESVLWTLISLANHLDDSVVFPGQVLNKPQLNRRYVVRPGDTLWALAEHNYGSHNLVTTTPFLAAANLIGDPNRIDVGQVIFFPALSL